MPVKLEMIESGKKYRFERLLVVSQPMRLSVPYKHVGAGKVRRRGQRTSCC